MLSIIFYITVGGTAINCNHIAYLEKDEKGYTIVNLDNKDWFKLTNKKEDTVENVIRTCKGLL